jgi:hypothetical protein
MFLFLIYNFSSSQASKEKDENKLKQRLSFWLSTYWLEFDNVYMKPKLIHNWPSVIYEHEDVSKIIKNVIKEYKNKDRQEDLKIENLKKQLNDDELDREGNYERHLSRDEISHEPRDYDDDNNVRFGRLHTDEKTYFK